MVPIPSFLAARRLIPMSSRKITSSALTSNFFNANSKNSGSGFLQSGGEEISASEPSDLLFSRTAEEIQVEGYGGGVECSPHPDDATLDIIIKKLFQHLV